MQSSRPCRLWGIRILNLEKKEWERIEGEGVAGERMQWMDRSDKERNIKCPPWEKYKKKKDCCHEDQCCCIRLPWMQVLCVSLSIAFSLFYSTVTIDAKVVIPVALLVFSWWLLNTLLLNTCSVHPSSCKKMNEKNYSRESIKTWKEQERHARKIWILSVNDFLVYRRRECLQIRVPSSSSFFSHQKQSLESERENDSWCVTLQAKLLSSSHSQIKSMPCRHKSIQLLNWGHWCHHWSSCPSISLLSFLPASPHDLRRRVALESLNLHLFLWLLSLLLGVFLSGFLSFYSSLFSSLTLSFSLDYQLLASLLPWNRTEPKIIFASSRVTWRAVSKRTTSLEG